MDIELTSPEKYHYSQSDLSLVGVEKVRDKITLSLEGEGPMNEQMVAKKVSAKITFSSREAADWIDKIASMAVMGGKK